MSLEDHFPVSYYVKAALAGGECYFLHFLSFFFFFFFFFFVYKNRVFLCQEFAAP